MSDLPYNSGSNMPYPPFFYQDSHVVGDQMDSPPIIGIQVTEWEALPPLDNEDGSPGSGPGSFPPTPPNMPNSFSARSNRSLQISTSSLSLEVPSKQYRSAPNSPSELLPDSGFLGSQDPSKDTLVGRRRAHSHSGYPHQLAATHDSFSPAPSAPSHGAFASPRPQDRNWRSDGSPYSDTTSLDQSPFIDDTHDFEHPLSNSPGSPLLFAEDLSLYTLSSNNQSTESLEPLTELFFPNNDVPSPGSGAQFDQYSWNGALSFLLDPSFQQGVPPLTVEPQVNSTRVDGAENPGSYDLGSVYPSNSYQPQHSNPSLQHPTFSNNESYRYLPPSLDASQLGNSSSTNNDNESPAPVSLRVRRPRPPIRGPRPKPTNRRPPDEEVIARKQQVFDALVQSGDKEEARARVEALVDKTEDVAYLDDFEHAISHHPKESEIGRERAIKRRRREPTFKCILCGDLMTTNNNLQNHYRSHLSMSVYKCSFCCKRFMTDSIYQRHLKTTAKCPGSAKYAASKAQNSPLDDFSQGSSASGSLSQTP